MTDPDNLRLGRSGVAAEPQDPYWIVVRASVHLPRLPRDREALVDASDPFIQSYLAAGFLVPVGDQDELERGQ